MLRPTTRLALLLLGLAGLACAGPEKQAQSGGGTGAQADLSDLTVLDFDPDRARSGEATSSTGEVVATEDLPANLRAILDAWHQGGFIWELKRSEVLSSPEETDFLVSNLILLLFDEARAMQAATTSVDADPSQRPLLVRVRSELRLCGAPAARALAETLGLGNDMLASMAIDILGDLGVDAAPCVAGLLDRDAAVVRYRALGCLARLPSAGDAEGEVIAALCAAAKGDSSEIVRVAAVRTLGERGLFSQAGRRAESVDFTPWIEAVEASLTDPAEAVRIEALGALGMLGELSTVPVVIDFGSAARGPERSAARRTLESLTGQRFGTNFAAWKSWWMARVAQDES